MSKYGAPEAVAWHDVECGAYAADLPLWRELAADAQAASSGGCEILDLGCGSGRVSLDLALRGYAVTALDIEPDLIAALRGRAVERGIAVNAVVADARSFELQGHFDLVLAPMQLFQLLEAQEDRIGMLRSIRRCLRPRGRAALTLVDSSDRFAPEDGIPPVPDIREIEGWVYSSQPMAVRAVDGSRAIVIDRVRRAVSPAGELVESLSSVRLELVSPATAEREARVAGLVPQGRRHVPATEGHLASTVVMLGLAHGDGR